MNPQRFRVVAPLAVVLCGLPWWPAAAQSPGRVIFTEAIGGSSGVSGTILSLSPMVVEIEARGETQKIPIERIREVTFAGEPEPLKTARVAIARGAAGEALEEIAKIAPADMEGVEQFIVDELAFVRAAAAGGQAASTGEKLPQGLKAVQDYLGKHPQTHHTFAMQELLARLLARSGKYQEAAAALAPLDRGPPAYRVRAAAARAGLFYDQKKYAEAAAEFTAASQIPTDAKDGPSAMQKRVALIGAARCLSRQGKAGEAVALIEKAIGESAAEDVEVLGPAYAAIGDALRTAGRDQDAIIAFLTVDMVHNKVSDSRAEALFNLVELWDKNKYPQRAAEARQQLVQGYPDSIWARRLAGGRAE